MSDARHGRMRRLTALCALLAAFNLLAGLSGGLARLGVPGPALSAAAHGVLMLNGFFGTLIALERAVALGRAWSMLPPLMAGLGGVAMLLWPSPSVACLLWLAASCGLVAVYAFAAAYRAWSVHLLVEMLGAVCWAVGIVRWTQSEDVAAVTLGGTAFLVLTIAGERRELTRMLRLPAAAHFMFALCVLCLMCGAIVGPGAWPVPVLPPGLEPGPALFWAGGVLLALWLLSVDIAPRGRALPGWTGHTAHCLAVGYGWLLVGSALGLAGSVAATPLTMAGLHAVLLGFVFAMVFGHAPVILPALARLRPAYTPYARWPLHLMGASVLARLFAVGLGWHALLPWAGAAHVLAILSFGVIMSHAVRSGRRGTS